MGRKAQLVNIQNGVTNPQSPEVSLYFNETALSAPGTTIDTNIGWKERGKDGVRSGFGPMGPWERLPLGTVLKRMFWRAEN